MDPGEPIKSEFISFITGLHADAMLMINNVRVEDLQPVEVLYDMQVCYITLPKIIRFIKMMDYE